MQNILDEKYLKRFWERVARAGVDDCWPWRGATDPDGYGMFWTAGSQFVASRLALMLHLDRWLERKELACHTCDNPPCCNPAHLFVGSHKANAADMVAKGRAYYGGPK